MHEVRMKGPKMHRQTELLNGLLQRQVSSSHQSAPSSTAVAKFNSVATAGAQLSCTQSQDNFDIKSATKLLGNCNIGELKAVTSLASALNAAKFSEHPVPGSQRRHIQLEDLEEALAQVPTGPSSMVDQPKIPNVRWEDIGGLEDAKQDLREMVELPLKRAAVSELSALTRLESDPRGDYSSDEEVEELDYNGATDAKTKKSKVTRGRSGILLYGPPGTGKTLLVGGALFRTLICEAVSPRFLHCGMFAVNRPRQWRLNATSSF